MSGNKTPPQSRIVPALLIGGGCYAALDHLGPVMTAGGVNPLSALAAAGLAISAVTVGSAALRFLTAFNDTRLAKKPLGLKGTSGFITHLRELRHELIQKGWGPYWGAFDGKELIIDYVSNALTISPAGTKKDVGVVQPTVLSIRESKTVIDFKGTSACILADELRARGEIVRILNLGDVWNDILGKSSTYNLLCLHADNFWRPGGILDVSDDVYELCMQLYPEPTGSGGQSDNTYFRDGSRNLIGFAVQIGVLIKGYEATLGDAAQMLNDRESLLQHARWVAGRLAIEGDDQ